MHTLCLLSPPCFSLGTTRSLRPLSPASEAKIEGLLRQLQRYYKYRGVNLRTCCEDFDRHHIGVIQESQVTLCSLSILYVYM